MTAQGRRPRVRAPELRGRAWLNTGGAAYSISDLRGRFVLLDFWTFCCVNCLHVLDELRPLERAHEGELVVVGVHSPKFAHEADPDALRSAVQRYEVTHPVLDDPELTTWQAYTARAWPTLVLVDPEGYVVAQYAGEGHAHAVDALVRELRVEHAERGTLQPGASPYVPPPAPPGDLAFPADVVALPTGGLLLADAGHHSLVELAPDGSTVLRRIGSGDRGHADGEARTARFDEPNGLCLLPEDVAREVGYDVVVADTVNHRLRGVRLADGTVRTLAGDGRPWSAGAGTGSLSSPWDVVWWQDRVWVAMAGVHQLWTFDPRTAETAVAVGTGTEGLRDGPAAEAWLAQTSGLAVDGDRLWLADSESSSLRVLEDGTVTTVLGSGLFDFGYADGGAEQAALQHPLGVLALPDGSVVVADTYNGALRRWSQGVLSTIADGLAEPSAAVLVGTDLVVVESSGHRLTRVPVAGTVAVDGCARATPRPVTDLAPGAVRLRVTFDPPPGQQVDDRFGPSSQLVVSATPAGLLAHGAGTSRGLSRELGLDPAVGEGVLHVAARAASCDAAGGEGAACHLHQQDWGLPVRLVAGAPDVVDLPLSARA